MLIILTAMPAFANSTATESVTVLVLGDSLTAGYGLDQGKDFPAQLEKSLQSAGHSVKVINAGVSGDTSAGGLARLDWALADQPEIVVIELGANDALRGLDPEQTQSNLESIITRIKDAGCRVVLAGMQAPRNFGPDYYKKFDRIYPDLAKRHDLLFYPFFLDGVATEPDLNQDDGIHPNSAGVRLIVDGMQPLIITALDEVRASKSHR